MTRRSRRLALVAAALAVIGCAVGLGLYAMKDSLSLFLTPAEIAEKNLRAGNADQGRRPRRGRLGRAFRRTGSGSTVTDGAKSVGVDCVGACFADVPDLFREGQGVVARERSLKEAG